MILELVYAAAEQPDPSANFVAQLFTNVITTGVIAALITSGVNYFTGRKNARIQERKNAVDAESDIVNRYKEQAAEERMQKESAVKTIRDLLAASEAQVQSLKDTVKALNDTIDLMSRVAESQTDIIKRLENERDRTDELRINAEKLRDEKIEELRKAQIEILELTRTHKEAERQARDTLGL